MKKLHCIICSNYRKSEKTIISHLLEKTLVLSIICRKCKNEDEKQFNWIELESIEMLKIIGVINNIVSWFQKI